MKKGNPKKLRIAIVGASTLKGREVKSVLLERKLLIDRLVLMDQIEKIGHLTEFDGELFLSQAIEPDSFEAVDAVFFASDGPTTRQFAPLAPDKGFLAIDMSQAFVEDVNVPLAIIDSPSGIRPDMGGISILSLPHASALSLSRLLNPLQGLGNLRSLAVTVLEPAAERGSAGLQELEQQARTVFSFQPIPKDVFDRQLAFNLLSDLGSEAKENLSTITSKLACQLHRLLLPHATLPALVVLQAPAFHCHSFAIFVEYETMIPRESLMAALDTPYVQFIPEGEEAPSPVRVAGTDQIQVGNPKQDLMRPNGWWIWAVADSLRIGALQAVAALEEYFQT
jgi:aspartate-semialdehyde dehydrogenase